MNPSGPVKALYIFKPELSLTWVKSVSPTFTFIDPKLTAVPLQAFKSWVVPNCVQVNPVW